MLTNLLSKNIRFSDWLDKPNVRPIIAILSLFLFGIATFWGFSLQYQTDILFNFSPWNMVVLTLSILYFITLSQYFLLRDKAFWYYSLYLWSTTCYVHYVICVLYGNLFSQISIPVYCLSACLLTATYLSYILFAIHFLNLKTEQPKLEKKWRLCVKLYLFLMLCHLLLPLFLKTIPELIIVRQTLISFCIPIGLYGIINCLMVMRGRLVRIFMLGTLCYFVGSVMGFLIASNIINNPFDNPFINQYSAFPMIGILLEIVFFSSGLAYRMRLIEIQKNKIEKEFFNQKFKELEVQNALLQQRERISHDLHDDVGATLNSISVFSAVAQQQFQKFNPEASPVLEQIGSASRHLVDVINDIVWAMNPKNDQFENITIRMRLFAADLLMSKDVNIDFEADERLNTINLDVEKRKHFYLIFKEAVNNVYKYAQCSTLKIKLSLDENNIQMTIKDNGKGFDSLNPKNGNGLLSMQERAKILRGSLYVLSEKNKGTSLELCFPIEDEE